MEERGEERMMEEEVGDDSGMVTWENVFKQGSLRVLLVEGDDSTRQIITALLRKCSYKVVAVSDGLKAWETLKEKPQNIDLVLAEVEVPSISGVGLLTKIMNHETCKSIPTILMSSNDSINMVFQCMLKGAADFLVKPVRRNELSNLWQHVWRRHSLNADHGKNIHQSENLEKPKFQANCGKRNHLSENVPSMQNSKECSEKGSDAQSSCTRSDMEAESTYKRNTLELKQPICMGLSLFTGTVGQDQIQPNNSLLVHERDVQDKSIMLDSEVTLVDGACISNEQIIGNRSRALMETDNEIKRYIGSTDNYSNAKQSGDQNCNQDTASKDAIDLIGAIDDQPQCSCALGSNPSVPTVMSNAPDVFHTMDVSCKSDSMPLLELSLRRYDDSSCKKEENKEWNTLNHSVSSAFSQYNNKTSVPPLLVPLYFEAEREGCPNTSAKITYQTSNYPSNGERWIGTSANLNRKDAESTPFGFPSHDTSAIKCSPLRVIPLHNPVEGMNFDGSSAGYGMQPMYYPPSSALPSLSAIPSMWQETVNQDTSSKSSLKDLNFFHVLHSHDQSSKSPIFHSEQRQEVHVEPRDERGYVSSALGESGTSSTCNDSSSHLNSTCASISIKTAENITTTNNCKVTAENGNEGKKTTDICRLNLRLEALNKFRLKRKDRCYEKKVRYHSRKRLAEQRPRMKGQFVRHIQPNCPTIEAGSYRDD